MFYIKEIKLSEKIFGRNKIVLLFDEETSSPCLYPLLYSIDSLGRQKLETQNFDISALQLWYYFWYRKYSTVFCASFLSSNYEPHIFYFEISNFWGFLESYEESEHFILPKHLRPKINYMMNFKRLSSVVKYFEYLMDKYLKDDLGLTREHADNYIKYYMKIYKNIVKKDEAHKAGLKFFEDFKNQP